MIETNQIYNMDCLDGLNKLKENSQYIDCIVTSPPYNLGGDFHTMVNGKRVTYGDYKGFKDKLKEDEYQSWQIEVLNACYDVLKDDGVMFYNHKNRIVKGTVISPFEWIHKTKFNVNQVIIMNLKSTANVDKRRFFPVYELIYVLTKEKGLKLNNYECFTDVWEVKKVPRKVSGHPATFHEEVPRRCIEASTKEGDIVLDPFLGSGTTCKVAKDLNRQYIGFDVSEEYIDLADKKIN
ncbi:DNA-methyltransferase [Priestia megaterium]|uniref:DNA-methyltransferase n=1 Tax=Priestia megaterium TaxID=1404 RepID=UPI0028775B17|nr:site-specific DNA-methyltransferase [Priestia megaterium]